MSQTRLYLTCPKPEAYHIATLLDDYFEEQGISTALFEHPSDNKLWCYSLYIPSTETEHWCQRVHERLGSDCFGLEIQQEALADVDWVSQTLSALTPVSAGRFFVHGSHDRDEATNKPIAVEIDAGQAFGTGHHGTTAGCLDMLEVCLRHGQGAWGQPATAYDIGTGSGVLAIALAKALHIPVLATDIDPTSTRIAHENCINNKVARHVRCETATGFQHPIFKAFGKADLVFANILARPLEGLARPMSAHLNSGAHVILSGLLPHQRARIVAAYAKQGIIQKRFHIRDGWLTLLMQAR